MKSWIATVRTTSIAAVLALAVSGVSAANTAVARPVVHAKLAPSVTMSAGRSGQPSSSVSPPSVRYLSEGNSVYRSRTGSVQPRDPSAIGKQSYGAAAHPPRVTVHGARWAPPTARTYIAATRAAQSSAKQPAAAQNSDGTYSETTGNNANTWTNYTNAGGSQGPTIPGYATVEIACWVQGFRVQDGNTYWYLVASSPWNYNYYVSADPFYNNGSTSGSLHGTPFVDPSVPSCNSGVSGVGETAGGAANTWTNYTNAGGQQGPTIGGGSTVIIACKLAGFRVSDGNTWWYQIASHPWNNSYYVSADAFYDNGQTSGSLKGTPFDDPNVPNCSTGGTGGGGSGSGTVNETVGGTSNTWTNYANAGGTQGPSIPNGTTVGISCKLTGFQVPDGNTWWYEIGSSPWNSNYFVSADAFYNNGSTSGSLRGTPFVDAAVPDCTPSSGGPGNVRPNTEIAGGAAQTWANYSHAGGAQGPTIAGGSSIVVTCRAQGFRVADGNTWWYQIASAPWDNVYYVSADPFYNNGASSGPLANTPFDDPSVPICVNNQEAPLYSTSLATGRATSHAPVCTRQGNYPINCASGDFWHTFTDLSIHGRGPGLVLERTYNSLAPTSSGLFGYGWNSTWDQQLTFNSGGRTDGSIVVTLPDGSQLTATPNGNGGFTTPPSTDTSFQSNSNGSYTLAQHHLNIETFSATGQLIALADLNSNTTNFTYNSAGQLATVTDGAGRQVTVTFGSNGLVAAVIDPLGRTTTYAYDNSNDLTSVTDALRRTWSYSYDSNHRMVTMTDPRGGVVTNTYDASSGQITKQVDPAGLATTFAYTGDNYGSVGGTTTITDPHGNIRLEQYANGFLTQVTRALGTSAQATWTYTYDPSTFGQTSATDPNGHVTTKTFDSTGHELTSTDPLGRTTTTTYNSLGEPLSVTTPSGNSTTNTYDSSGNLLTVTDPLGNVTTNAYSSSHPGDVVSVSDAVGDVTQISYDSYGDVSAKSVSPAAGVSDTMTAVYDADGELVCQASGNATNAGTACPAAGASPVAGTSSRVFDAAGQVTSSTDADGHTTTFAYDADGNKTSVTDPIGNQTVTTYDGDNRVTAVISGANAAGSSTTHTAYDLAPGAGSCPATAAVTYCTTNTDANGAVTTHAFDANDHEIETVRPGTQVTTFTYDAAGNKLTQTAPNTVVTTNTYDSDNHLTTTSYSDGTTPAVSYSYDADGRRTAMTDGSGTTTYTYDADGRLLTETNGAAAATGYSYDGDGHTTAQIYPNGNSVSRTYNGAGWLSSVTDWLGKTTKFGYDADGNLTTTTYPNGDVIITSYDAADTLIKTVTSYGPRTLAAIAYTRTAANLISSETDSGVITGSITDTYDAKNELTSVGARAFAYDPAGNITTITGLSQKFNAQSELTSFPTTQGFNTVSYDANGNRTDVSPTTWGRDTLYTYDAENRLIDITLPVVTPSVTGVSSTSGSQAGGNIVTVQGRGFTEATSVHFGTQSATGLTVISDSRLQITAPAGTPGTVDVTVTATGGTSAATGADHYAYTAAPGVTSLTPTAGQTAAGSTVIMTGAGFTGATSVKFGATAALRFTVNSDTQITATAPGGTAAVAVSVKTPKGTSPASAFATYTYSSGTAVTGISPSSGPTSGGTTVTVSGTGFSGATAVSFGTKPAVNFTVISDNTLTATAPAGSGATDITVTGAANASTPVTIDRFTYAATPQVSTVTRSGTAAGGNTVTITGSGFTPSSTVSFGASQALAHYISSATLLAIAPAGTGTVDVTVTTAGGTSSKTPADIYSFTPPITNYTYNGDGLRTATTSPAGTTTYTWDTTTTVPSLLTDGSNSYIYGPDNTPIEHITTTGTTSYYFHDAIGSTRALFNSAGSVTGTFTYSPYGALTTQVGTATTPILYAAGYLDTTSKLYYLNHRYYDPTTAQFLTLDPAINTTGIPYAYALNNPTNEIDPTGTIAWLSDLGTGLGALDSAAHIAASGAVRVARSAPRFAEDFGRASDVLDGAVLLYGNANEIYECSAHGLSSSSCSDAENAVGQDYLALIPFVGVAETFFPAAATRFTGDIESGVGDAFYNLGSLYYGLRQSASQSSNIRSAGALEQSGHGANRPC